MKLQKRFFTKHTNSGAAVVTRAFHGIFLLLGLSFVVMKTFMEEDVKCIAYRGPVNVRANSGAGKDPQLGRLTSKSRGEYRKIEGMEAIQSTPAKLSAGNRAVQLWRVVCHSGFDPKRGGKET